MPHLKPLPTIVFLTLGMLVAGLVGSRPTSAAFLAQKAKTPGADLHVTMLRSDDDPRPLLAPGQTVSLSIGVNNLHGTSDAHSSTLTVTLPGGLALVQATPTPDRTDVSQGGAKLIWNLGTVPAGDFPHLYEVVLIAAPSVQTGTVLAVEAVAETSDRNPGQSYNRSTFAFQVEPTVAHLAVQSDLSAVALTVTAPVEFTAGVSNWGDVAAAATTLTLTLPPKVSFKSSDPAPAATKANSITWQLGDIAPAGSRTVAVTIALDVSLGDVASEAGPENLLKFAFDASSSTRDVDPATNHLEIDRHVEMPGPNLKVALSIQGADNPGELKVGSEVTYTITYGNFGNAPAHKASVLLNLCPGLDLVRADPSPTSSGKSDKVSGVSFSWDVGDLTVGQSKIIKSHVHVASVSQDGSLVMATISAPDATTNSEDSIAYSWRYAARAAGNHASSALIGHGMWLIFRIVVFGAALLASLITFLKWRLKNRTGG